MTNYRRKLIRLKEPSFSEVKRWDVIELMFIFSDLSAKHGRSKVLDYSTFRAKQTPPNGAKRNA